MASAAGHRAAALLAVSALLLLAGAALTEAAGGAARRQQRGPSSVRAPLAVKPVCVKVHGVVAGETCASVARDWRLTDQVFGDLNPNVNCANLFLGQWLCVDGALIG